MANPRADPPGDWGRVPGTSLTAMPTSLPQAGRDASDVIAELRAKRANDVDWSHGRTFGLVYDGGPEVHDGRRRAAREFLHENALNTKAFPSLGCDPVRGRELDRAVCCTAPRRRRAS